MIFRKLGEIRYIVLHCSDSDVKSHDNIQTIESWHKQRGFSDIGYNYFITKNGDRFYGRSLFHIGAHAIGYNRNSIGICLSGKKEFTIKQEKSLFDLIMDICEEHVIEKVIYHRDITKGKTCPNFSWDWIERVNEALQAKEI